MKLPNRQHGRIALWDLLILVLAITLCFLLYIRGRLDRFLPKEYAAATVLAHRAAQPEQEPPRRPNQAPSPEEVERPESTPEEVEPSETPDAAAETPDSSAPLPEATPEGEEPTAPEAAATPTPSPTPEAAPEATPEPTPIEISKVERAYWPKRVRLLRTVTFPVILNGRQAGSMKAPSGMEVTLLEIRGTQVVLQNGEATITIPAGDTDTLERIGAILRRRVR